MKIFLALLLIFFPSRVKRYIYEKLFGFQIHVSARIGMSLILPSKILMDRNSRIGHLNVIKGVTLVSLGESASIGNLNWISGFPEGAKSPHFADQISRSPKLFIGDHSAITNRHLIDCTDTVKIGRLSTFAGFRSQILTHSISITESRQLSGPVVIGDYAFVGSGSIILPNSCLPSYSVLGAGSVLNKNYDEEYQLYAGNPARPIKSLDRNSAYFGRKTGSVI
jgi:acetyltransferase-like isoleucine patch superfamily enzyme